MLLLVGGSVSERFMLLLGDTGGVLLVAVVWTHTLLVVLVVISSALLVVVWIGSSLLVVAV
jgi:hypothetical protein